MPKVGVSYDVFSREHQQIGDTLIPLIDGTYVMAAHSQLNQSATLTQTFDADFTSIGEQVSTENQMKIPNLFGFYASVGLSNGGYALGWYIRTTAANTFNGVYMQLFNADGTKISSEIRLGDFGNLAGVFHNYEMSATEDGGLAVSWIHEDVAHLQVISPTGEFVGTTHKLTTVEENTFEHSEINRGQDLTILKNGNILTTWYSEIVDRGIVVDGHIITKLFKPDGTPIGTEFEASDSLSAAIFKGLKAPVVTSLKDGGSMLVWADGIPEGTPSYGFVATKPSIHGQILNADGTKRGDDFYVDGFLGYGKTNLSITTLVDGSIVVVWQAYQQIEEYEHNQGKSRIYGQKLSADGVRQGGEFRVDLAEAETQNIGFPEVSSTADGGFVVNFIDNTYFQSIHVSKTIKFGAGEFIEGGFTDKLFDSGGIVNDGQGATITGTSLGDYIQGNYHGDEILGGAGGDIILGGRGDDKIYGGQGDDFIVGETGYDLIVDGLGNNTIYGKGEQDEIFTFSGLNDIRGGNAADILMGGIHADKIASGNFLGVETHEKADPHGAGVIIGDSSSLFGSADFLDGGGGGVYIMGGKGADTFFFQHGDFGGTTIASFNIADITINKNGVGTFLNYIVTPTGADFQPNVDHIELYNFSDDLTSDNVLDAITDTDDGAKFEYASNEFLLYGIEKSELSTDDFWIL